MADDHLSEAACLLEQGATYRRRVGLQPLQGHGEPIFAGFKPGAFAIYFGDAPFYHFDLEGRWQRAFVDGTHFLKALDGTVQSIDRVREGPNLVLKRSTLAQAAAERFRLAGPVNGAGIDRGTGCRKAGPRRAILAQGDAAFAGRAPRFSRADQPLGLVRLARPSRALSRDLRPDAFPSAGMPERGHSAGDAFVRPSSLDPAVLRRPSPTGARRTIFSSTPAQVAALWGRRLLQSRTIFLAGSDVLRLPEGDVVEYLNAIRRVFPIEAAGAKLGRDRTSDDSEAVPRFEGVHAFLDDFAPGRPDCAALAAFAPLGLTRISVGVVSGDRDVRSLYQQGWSDDDLRTTFADLKSAGIGASVLTLVGAGGVEHAKSHVARTAALVMSLDLQAGDFVFLLDENELREPGSGPAEFRR